MQFCKVTQGGNSSVGRARPCQGRGREFESRFPLQKFDRPSGQHHPSGNSSVGRARPCQGRGREFESRFPLQNLTGHQASTTQAGIAQLVEHDLAKVGVASSSLVSRSKFSHHTIHSIKALQGGFFIACKKVLNKLIHRLIKKSLARFLLVFYGWALSNLMIIK